MSKPEKTLRKVLAGTADANIPFRKLCGLLRGLGFLERVHGSHHIFARRGVSEIINLQPRGGNAKRKDVDCEATTAQHRQAALGLCKRHLSAGNTGDRRRVLLQSLYGNDIQSVVHDARGDSGAA